MYMRTHCRYHMAKRRLTWTLNRLPAWLDLVWACLY